METYKLIANKFQQINFASLFRHWENEQNRLANAAGWGRLGHRKNLADNLQVGDSGGPLQLDDHKCLYNVVGVTSFGKHCGVLGSAGMYTRVEHYVPWIESIVWPGEMAEYGRFSAECITDGVNGTCHNIFKCPSAALSYIYTLYSLRVQDARRVGVNPSIQILLQELIATADDIANAAGCVGLAMNAGDGNDVPPLPEICSYDNQEPIVCCTDCWIDDKQGFRNSAIGTNGVPTTKSGPLAYNKCLEYLQRLPYPCPGKGNSKVKKIWNADKKCHGFTFSSVLAVGGRDAQRWEFPHMALLGYGADKESAEWLCGGSIISERFIITAAHCSHSRTLEPVKFAALGILKRTDPQELWHIYDIKRMIIHPDYKAPVKYNDIALLETESEINFSELILPACLDTGKIQNDYGAQAAGWGRLGHNKGLADTLQVVYLNEFNESECATMYFPHRHLTDGYNHTSQMCYGSHSQIIDTCEGDSGGPLQVNEDECLYTIVGLTSFGKNCGALGSAGMYTRVEHFRPWIESYVWPGESAEIIDDI